MPVGVEGTGFWTTNAYGEPEWIEYNRTKDFTPTFPGSPDFDAETLDKSDPTSNAAQQLAQARKESTARLQPTDDAGGGSGLSADELAWRNAYLKEHAGVAPDNWDVQRELRDASAIWAAQHGNNPYSWGNRVGDNRVPQEVFKRLNTARSAGGQSGYKPTMGQIAGWATDADELGGAYMAMRGERYHPVGELETETKKTLLNAILGAYRR